jgi:glycosyltransferase involved in cell wall biosynthesis
MKIALVNTIKPVAGSGNGVVEYAHQLYEHIRRGNDVDVVYALGSPKRNNLPGLIYTNTLFRSRVKRLISGDYDIVHITDQEIGFVARMLHGNTRAKVITTVHDFARFSKSMHRGLLQKGYSALVKRNVKSALEFSDAILFDSRQMIDEVKSMFWLPRKYRVINLGVKDSVLQRKPAHDRRGGHDKEFRIGYIGSFSHHKNVIMILKAAEILKGRGAYRFLVYGTGSRYKALSDYKSMHGLKNVEFMGFAQESRIAQIYDSFDVYMHPVLYTGFELEILEAQARGLPVIIYKYGKIPEEVTKYCLKAENAEDAARIIRDLKEHGYDEKLKKRATAYARSFRWSKTAEATLGVYKELLRTSQRAKQG